MTNSPMPRRKPHPARSISSRKIDDLGSAKLTTLNWAGGLFWVYYGLAVLFSERGRPDDAHAHIERAKSYVVDDVYKLGLATELQAGFWYDQRMLEEAKLEALRAVGSYQKVGATKDLEHCRELLEKIDGLDSDGELL